MAVSKKLKRIYTGFFSGIENFAADRIITLQERLSLAKNMDRRYKLSREQKAEIREFWKPYCRVSTSWTRYYAARNGRFDPRYIPNTLYYTKIDRHFNSKKLGDGFNDKNYYSLIFAGVKQPETIARNIGGLFFDGEYRLISAEKALEAALLRDEVILKPAEESGSGRGIGFFKPSDAESLKKRLFDKNEKNYLIQAVLRQHPDLENVHSGSVNTIRICTIMLEDGVHILSSVLRMGVDKSRLDNVTSGGVSAAIRDDGTLDKYAYTYYSGKRIERHPQGLVFEGFRVPSFDKAKQLALSCAEKLGNFRLVSWDIAVDESGEAVLIEANMRKGGINLHQFDNGPLFGELTSRVLGEVFPGKGRK